MGESCPMHVGYEKLSSQQRLCMYAEMRAALAAERAAHERTTESLVDADRTIDRLQAFVDAWDKGQAIAEAQAMSGYVRATPEQRKEAEDAYAELLAARCALTEKKEN